MEVGVGEGAGQTNWALQVIVFLIFVQELSPIGNQGWTACNMKIGPF